MTTRLRVRNYRRAVLWCVLAADCLVVFGAWPGGGPGMRPGRAGAALVTTPGATLIPPTLGTRTATPIRTRTPVAGCIGDCDSDGTVTIDELIHGVAIALESAPLATCPAFDANGDRAVTIEEITTAVNRALDGC